MKPSYNGNRFDYIKTSKALDVEPEWHIGLKPTPAGKWVAHVFSTYHYGTVYAEKEWKCSYTHRKARKAWEAAYDHIEQERRQYLFGLDLKGAQT